jgi:diguanylate cyclase (GGDEF)-like protein
VRAWHALLAAAVVVIAAYYGLTGLGPGWAGLQAALYAGANGVLAVTAAVVAWRRRPLRVPLLFISAGALSAVAGDVIFWVLTLLDGEVAYPSPADVAYLATYPLISAGLLIIVRRRTPGWDGASALDAAIVAVSAGYLVYALVIAPTMDVTTGNIATLVSVAYPVGDLMVITVGTRLLFGAGPRPVALRMLGTYLLAVLFADTIYSVLALNGTYYTGHFLDAVWMGAEFLLAAGLAHPSSPQLVTRSSTMTPDATPARMALLALAAVVAPTVMMVQHTRGVQGHLVVIGGIACNLLFLLALARMAGLVRAHRHAAVTDGLTGLRSRRFFEQSLRAEAARSARGGGELSMLLLDIDRFKEINEESGPAAGDRVLVEVATRLAGVVRPGDLLARYGGAEFAVLLPATTPARAEEVAQRIRRSVGMAPISVSDTRLRRVTVSVGLAGLPAIPAGVEELVTAAAGALGAAKEAGRDRVTTAV